MVDDSAKTSTRENADQEFLGKSLRDDTVTPSSKILLDQFYVTLRVIQRGIERSRPNEERSAIHKDVEDLFGAGQSWGKAYEIEQRQCLLLSGEQLNTELQRRLAEAKSILPYLGVLNGLLEPNKDGSEREDPTKRAVLHRLVNDLQWFYTQRFQRSQAARSLNGKITKLFIAAFLLLLTALIIQLGFFPPPGKESSASAAPPASASSPGG